MLKIVIFPKINFFSDRSALQLIEILKVQYSIIDFALSLFLVRWFPIGTGCFKIAEVEVSQKIAKSQNF